MTNKNYSTAIAELQYKEGIMYVTFNSAEINLAQAQLFITDMKREFGDLLPLPILADVSAQRNPKKEGRDYLGSPEATQYFKAIALVANSVLSKIAGNLFLMFSNPNVPTKIFTENTAALAWLKPFQEAVLVD